MAPSFLIPDWPAPANVRALATTRSGGVSLPPYTSFNLGEHVGDDPAAVAANRALLHTQLPAEPAWLTQVHGVACLNAESAIDAAEADATVSRTPSVVCAVMTADCLPVLLCNRAGTVVGAAHAGWRGLLAGVVENTLSKMACPSEEIVAWFGPAIGPQAFEVGAEVRTAFVAHTAQASAAFVPHGAGKYLCDIYLLARQRLAASGVNAVYGGEFCTVSEPERFFSFRRDGVTGRMVSLIWLDHAPL